MKRYERILVLRVIGKQVPWIYELVEIPKSLMLLAQTGKLEMMMESRQMPKPGYCHVFDGYRKLFDLYFDGGTERKLQVKGLDKSRCHVHAEWRFSALPSH